MTTAAINATQSSDRTGARLWECIRALTDAELEELQRALVRLRSIGGDNVGAPTESTVSLLLPVKPAAGVPRIERWEADAFVDSFLSYLHELAHDQSQVEAAATASNGTEGGEQGSSQHGFAFQSEDFPSLGARTVPSTRLNGKLKAGKDSVDTPVESQSAAKTPKRRIKTTLISTDAPYSAVAVNQPAANSVEIAPDSAWLKKDLLDRRMTPTKKLSTSQSKPANRLNLLMGNDLPVPTQTTAPMTKTAPANPWMSPPPSSVASERQPPPLVLQGKHKKSKRLATMVVQTPETKLFGESPAPLPMPEQHHVPNINAARLYGHMILHRLVSSVCTELQFLVSLMYRPSCASTATCATSNEFCDRECSSAFATKAFEEVEDVLMQLNVEIIQLVAKSLEDLKLCENLSLKLRDSIQKREELRVDESAKLGCELPVETKVTAFRDYALPFCEDMDSRLNYRSPTESVIYSNRERVRDAFLSQLRLFQKKQNSLLPSGGASSDGSSASAAKQLLVEVMPENMWWFARFFALELVQVGSNPLGESDKELVLKIMEDKMVGKNPDRLRKLHRRFSSQKAPDAIGFNTATQSTATSRPKMINNPTQQRQGSSLTKGRATISSNETDTSSGSSEAVSTTTTADRMRSYCTDNQLFFYHFLLSCDSYQFAQLVKHQLEAQFMSVWRARGRADPRKEFTETVLRLKVLAKFLGLLRFSPQWHWSSLTTALSSKNPALEAAQREAVATMDSSHSANAFDVLALLEESIASHTITKCIPWLCDYLVMALSDSLSVSTRYFQRVLLLLAYLHRSRFLDQLGETGMYVAMQIERLFYLLALEDLIPRGLKWHRTRDGKLPSWMKPSTAQALHVDQMPQRGDAEACIDHLPFLYSSMLVQVCISELDDLRGFIQTRARATHVGDHNRRQTVNGLERSQVLRKVRPLQVLREDHLDLAAPAFTVETSEDGVATDSSRRTTTTARDNEDPLREAFFKLYPHLKRAAEFVVDIVVTNMCEHAIAKHVKPNADALIDACVDAAKLSAPSFTQLILHEFQLRLDERLEDFMSTTVKKAVREAHDLCSQRIEAALRPLVAPTVPEQLIVAATGLAQAQAKDAVTSLITRSLKTEFLKRVAARKRAIIKEAGGAAATAAAAVSAAELSGEGSVTRALKFSFDESTDTTQTPLEEAMQGVRRSVVGMSGALQATSAATKAAASKRLIASLVRFQRSFRSNIDDVIEELQALDASAQNRHAVELWSWTWRAVRLWLKAFASIIASHHIPSEVDDFIADFAKTLQLIQRWEVTYTSPRHADAVVMLCRFVGQSAVSISTKDEPQEVATQVCVLLVGKAIAIARQSLVEPRHDLLATWLDPFKSHASAHSVLARLEEGII